MLGRLRAGDQILQLFNLNLVLRLYVNVRALGDFFGLQVAPGGIAIVVVVEAGVAACDIVVSWLCFPALSAHEFGLELEQTVLQRDQKAIDFVSP